MLESMVKLDSPPLPLGSSWADAAVIDSWCHLASAPGKASKTACGQQMMAWLLGCLEAIRMCGVSAMNSKQPHSLLGCGDTWFGTQGDWRFAPTW
jgi:hypothetical protein